MPIELVSLTRSRSEFHSVGPAKEKDISPTLVFVLGQSMCSALPNEEHNDAHESMISHKIWRCNLEPVHFLPCKQEGHT